MKYILKKEYPGSPKLGNTIDNLENDWIENYPEFWEEVVEKDYEILSYITIESEIIKYKDLNINDECNCDKYLKIYSVKRLSDGEIFTVGDKIDFVINSNLRKDTIHKIKSIELNPNGIVFRAENSSWSNYLNEISKIKKPLFTTEQRSEIEEIIKNIVRV